MKIVQVEVEDFLSVGKAEFSLDSRGLVLIQGENLDNPSASSNGSGKSSLVDAVCWCLYGETARGVPAVGVVRKGAKQATVSVWFEDETGTKYSVVRSRTKTKSALNFYRFDPSGKIDLTLGTEKLTQEAIVKALGASYEVFRAAVYIGQEGMPDLPAMTDKKLKELIEEAAGVGVIERAYALARERFTAAEKAHAVSVAHIEGRKSALTSVQADIVRLEGAIKAERVRIKSDEEAIDRAILTLENEKNDLLKTLPSVTDYVACKTRASQLQAEIDGLSGQEKIRKTLADLVATAEAGLASSKAKAATLTAIAVDAMKAADAVKAQEGQPCTSCGQPLSAHALEHACDAARRAAEARKADALIAAETAKGALESAHKAREALAKHVATMRDPSALIAELNVELGKLHAVDLIQAAVKSKDHEIDNARHKRSRLGASIEGLEKALESSRQMETDQIKEIAGLEGKAAQAEAHVRDLERVAKLFGPAGVRAHILDKVTPFLNDRTAAYLAILSDGTLTANWTTLVRDAKGNLKEKFAIEVTHPAGEGFAGLSGGERRKIRLACGMALQDLVASRATKPFRLWIVDECDEALDEAGLERLMTLLNEKAKEKGTVLVISHRSLTDWISQNWLITKKGGVSSLSGHD